MLWDTMQWQIIDQALAAKHLKLRGRRKKSPQIDIKFDW